METNQKFVEFFHLLFLKNLSEKLQKNLYTVKGGCNLRFFFKSIRYSEDLDLDIKTVAKETLRKKVNKLFESEIFLSQLKLRGMEIKQITEAKQTDTTQQWKLQITTKHSTIPIPTKIEFSRRQLEEPCLFEAVDPELIFFHQFYPILANHYTQEAAFCQKVDALIHRTEIQARDVFDIQLLLNRKISVDCLPMELRQQLNTAIENIFCIRFSDFKARVVAYLMESYQSYYTEAIWESIQAEVAATLEN